MFYCFGRYRQDPLLSNGLVGPQRLIESQAEEVGLCPSMTRQGATIRQNTKPRPMSSPQW
jgi:hypothetical protein